jgi:hypothetical protein
VLFHALSSPHGSAGNQSQNIRRILYIHFMAREVTEDGYPEWKYPPAAEARELAISYQALRNDTPSPAIGICDEGFVFTGAPGTPSWHWRTLISSLTLPEAERLRAVLAGPLEESAV